MVERKHIEKLENLELLANQVVEGFITGLHKSPFHGFSVEFAEHRLYNSGRVLGILIGNYLLEQTSYLLSVLKKKPTLDAELSLTNLHPCIFPIRIIQVWSIPISYIFLSCVLLHS